MIGQIQATAVPLACAGALAVLFTAAQIRFSPVLGWVAVPRADRWHDRPTPSSGGLAIFCATAVAYLLWFRGQHVPIALGASAMWMLGLVDDRMRLSAAVKLLGQSVVAACLVGSGTVFQATPSAAFNVVFSFLWLIGVTNAFNLIDNMDGLCAGVTVIIAGFRFALLAAVGNWADANLYAVIGAAYAGFLVLNQSPARIFMGDCGSMFAGFTLAALTIACPSPHTNQFVAAVSYPVLTFTYPIFDTVLVSVLRKSAGRAISAGGRDHSSHRLVSMGLTESRAVWILWGLTAVGSAIGLLAHSTPVGVHAAGALLWIALAVFGMVLASFALPGPGGYRDRGR